MSQPLITIRGLTKYFPSSSSPGKDLWAMYMDRAFSTGNAAVNNLDLDIGRGERIGVIGRNGAGKSTLLHLIAGLSPASSGRIDIQGKVTSVLTLGVGLRDDFSGRQNIYIDGDIQGKSRSEIELVVDEIIAFADIGGFIDQPVRTYSTGMKARLAFSMIAHIDPEILIIDEALSVGDAAFSVKATQRIKEICARGKIVIIVSHSMQAIREICNRCLWMQDGRIVMDGSPEAVTSAYIDSVRSADELELKKKFQKLMGGRTYADGCRIIEVCLYDNDATDTRALLEVGKPVLISVSAEVAARYSNCNLRVQITRLDGLVMFSEVFEAESYRLHDETLGLEIALGPLALGPTVYRVDVMLEHEDRILADLAQVFETYTLNAPSGGKPMLMHPATITVSPL